MTNLSPSTPYVPSVNWTLNSFSDDDDKRKKLSGSMEAFFMVEWLNVRKHQLTPREIHRMQDNAWKELMKDGVEWVILERVLGAEDVKRAYERVAKEGFKPHEGFVWSLWEGDAPRSRTKL
jgi:methionine synthase I (cobalamin-dependent)